MNAEQHDHSHAHGDGSRLAQPGAQDGAMGSSVRDPVCGMVVDPRRAFGKPVIAGTATPTETLAGLIRAGESPEQVAEDFRLTTKQVEDAWQFEKRAA